MILSETALVILQGMMLKIMPLYVVMGLGFVLGRARPAAAEPLAFLQIYFIVPVVIVSSFFNYNCQQNYLWLPVLTYLGCCVVSLTCFAAGKLIWKDNTPHIFSYACGSANTGYYGIPVALILFPAETIGLFMMAVIGYTLFESTLGYYLVARGHFTMRDSLQKLIRLPLIYAFILGVGLSIFGYHVPDFAKDIARDFRGCYVVIGALMIGLGLARLQSLKIDAGLIAFVFAFKFLMWPLLAFGFIMIDRMVFHEFTPQIHSMLLLLSIMPLPANAIAFALQLNVQPDKASTLVFFSTVFALFYIPLVMVLWGNY